MHSIMSMLGQTKLFEKISGYVAATLRPSFLWKVIYEY